MDIEQTKNLFKPRIGTKVKIKVRGEKRYRHGILEKVDTYLFGGLDFGEHEALFLRQKRKTLVIRLKEIEQII